MSRARREWLAIGLLVLIEVCLVIAAWVVPIGSAGQWLVFVTLCLLVPYSYLLMTGANR